MTTSLKARKFIAHEVIKFHHRGYVSGRTKKADKLLHRTDPIRFDKKAVAVAIAEARKKGFKVERSLNPYA